MSASEACVDDSCSLPDIANEPHSGPNSPLNWVGMSEIEMPVFLMNGQQERIQSVARVQAYVNLIDPNSKGIHMSRLYLAIDEILSNDVLTPALLGKVVGSFAESHYDLSDSAYLECRVDFFERRKSLKSDNTGWKSYKVRPIISLIKGEVSTELCIEVPYSSTCPCSAALARDLIQQGFEAQFAAQSTLNYSAIHDWLGTTAGISATPHSQRSVAQIRVRLNASVDDLPISRLIDQIENALQTPVQAAVKRADEQEFARLNASNLMFCEDAARRLQATLANDTSLDDFWIRVNHMESLHPHNAVAVVVKGLKNGYRDDPREFPH